MLPFSLEFLVSQSVALFIVGLEVERHLGFGGCAAQSSSDAGVV